MNNITQRTHQLSPITHKIKIACLLGLVMLLTLLTSCGILAQQPPSQAIQLAIEQQLSNSQQNIAQSLGNKSLGNKSLGNNSAPLVKSNFKPNFKINNLDITSREKVFEKRFQRKGYPNSIYKVRGTVEATLTAANRKIQQSSPFELYLGTNEAEKARSKKPPKSTSAENNNQADQVETWYLISPDAPKLPQ